MHSPQVKTVLRQSPSEVAADHAGVTALTAGYGVSSDDAFTAAQWATAMWRTTARNVAEVPEVRPYRDHLGNIVPGHAPVIPAAEVSPATSPWLAAWMTEELDASRGEPIG